jgi:hypothetical protein
VVWLALLAGGATVANFDRVEGITPKLLPATGRGLRGDYDLTIISVTGKKLPVVEVMSK